MPSHRHKFFVSVLATLVFGFIFLAPQHALAVDGEITYTGTNTGLTGDDIGAGPFNLGFTFPFFGTNYTQAYVNINGTLNFGALYSRYNNMPLNTSISGDNIADNSIYAFWDDLNTNGSQNIYYATVGEAPNRKFVTQWTNIYFHSTSIQVGTFQVILYEGTNEVQIQYRDLLGGSRALGDSATVGIRKNNALSLQYLHNTASLSQEQAIRYTPTDDGTYTVNTHAAYDLVYLAPAGAPTSPTLVNPTDGTTGVTLTPTFEWLLVNSATSYTVLISTVSNFSSTVVNQSGITGTSYTPASPLNQNTTYYWRVQSLNTKGSSLSPTRSFTTGSLNAAPNTPSAVSSALLTGGNSLSNPVGAAVSAVLSDSDADEQVRYRVQIATDSEFSNLSVDYRSAFGDMGPVTYTYGQTEGVYLVGTADTVLPIGNYYLRIRAEDDAAASSAWYTVNGIAFTIVEPRDEQPPVLSAVAVINIGTSAVTITWNTDEISDSQIEYGTTNEYGLQTAVDDTMTTGHSVTVTGLAANTTYHYRVVSKDAASNTAVSYDLVFTTEPLPDTTAPGISNISVNPESHFATMYWDTDEDASSMVEYGPSSSYTASTTEVNTSPRVLSHEIIISNLESCVTYHYRVVSRDASNNVVRSNDNSFTTKDCTGDAIVTAQVAAPIDNTLGGTVSMMSAGLGIRLVIPALFSTASAHFQIKKIDDTTARTSTGMPAGTVAAGAYTYELHAVTDDLQVIENFDEPIAITLAYGPSDTERVVESTLKIYRWHGSVWQQLSGCVVNTNDKTVTCSTDHFSTFGLFGAAPTPSSTKSSGTTIVARVKNLLSMGNVEAAESLKKDYPAAFPITTDTATIELSDKKLCFADQLLTQNLKTGARNGKYNTYAKTIVTEAARLQAHLNRLGFNSGAVDGILGPLSDGAIKRMQTYLGTTPDGMVGPLTRALLNNSCGSTGL